MVYGSHIFWTLNPDEGIHFYHVCITTAFLEGIDSNEDTGFEYKLQNYYEDET